MTLGDFLNKLDDMLTIRAYEDKGDDYLDGAISIVNIITEVVNGTTDEETALKSIEAQLDFIHALSVHDEALREHFKNLRE